MKKRRVTFDLTEEDAKYLYDCAGKFGMNFKDYLLMRLGLEYEFEGIMNPQTILRRSFQTALKEFTIRDLFGDFEWYQYTESSRISAAASFKGLVKSGYVEGVKIAGKVNGKSVLYRKLLNF